jgi:hypothetical protein
MSVIIVKLINVHKEEQKTLKEYLEHNCWAWEEISNEKFKQERDSQLGEDK